MRALASEFVPVADEVWRLQRGDDAECRFFQAFADAGHYRAAGGSRQGIYVVTPGGRLLASANELNAERLCDMLSGALEEWSGLTPAERTAGLSPELETEIRWEDSCPTDGLVLVQTLRDVPSRFKAGVEPLQPSNRDYVWFSREEASGLAESEPQRVMPFVRRLARFHLVDSVRGQSLPFAEEELQQLMLRVEHQGTEGGLSLRLSGSTSAAAKGPWLMGASDWTPDREYPRTIRTEFSGRALWNREAGVFTEFELVAIGTRSGFTQFNGRSREPKPSSIGFHFKLAEPGSRIPPAFVDVYDAEWIVPASTAAN